MKTVVLGKKIKNIYKVDYNWKQIEDDNGNIKTVYTDKPVVYKEPEITYVELCSYKGAPRYNSKNNVYYSFRTINISENESVAIIEEIFRADLNEMYLHTDKIIEETSIDKEDAESICNEQIKAFNKMMIESNEKLKSYCDIHKLSYEDTDCIELFKLVFPNKRHIIVNGEMKTEEKRFAQVNGAHSATIAQPSYYHPVFTITEK